MVITPHALVGAALSGRRILPALAVGIASHYVLDRVPHRDYDPGRTALLAADCTAAALLLLSAGRARPAQLAGALGGILPDLACVFEERVRSTRLGRWHVRAHAANHTRQHVSRPTSRVIQALTITGASLVLLRQGRARRRHPA